MHHETRRCFYFILLPVDVEYHEKEGIYVTEDFLGALTERMDLHYCNEATGMAANASLIYAIQSTSPLGNSLSSVKAYSVFFLSFFLAINFRSLFTILETYKRCVHLSIREEYLTWKS